MKKFFKKFFLILFFATIIFFAFNSILIIPENYVAVLKTKRLTYLEIPPKKINFVWQKGIPLYSKIIFLPKGEVLFKTQIKKEISFLNREIDNIDLKIQFNFKIQNYLNVAKNFSSLKEIEDSFNEFLKEILDRQVDFIIRNNQNFKTSLTNLENIYYESLKNNFKDFYFTKPSIIFSHIPYFLNLEKVKNYSEQLVEFEFFEKYIKDNPNFLKYILIQKINDKTAINIFLDTENLNERNNIKNNREK
jgi:hypothetical protein